jgi:SnoaL-like domain
MSEENVELVRRYFPAYEQGGLDAWAEFWHPDISWRSSALSRAYRFPPLPGSRDTARAMSQEDVEIVRKTIEARNRSLDDWLSFFHPDAQTSDLLTVAGMPTEARDVDELRRAAELWTEIFDEWDVEIVELLDLDELVIAAVRFHGRGGASGARATTFQVDLYRLREGLVTEWRSGYRSRDEALKAAGLSE